MDTSTMHRLGAPLPPLTEDRWRTVDTALRSAWDGHLRSSTEAEVRSGELEPGALFLPFPFLPAFGLEGSSSRMMFAWDTYFVDRGLLAHGRSEIVRDHIRNYLHLVERYGYMPNFSADSGRTRSQTPIYPDAIWRYHLATGDRGILHSAYPLLTREFRDYWNAPHHATPTGLATNRDLGDNLWPPEMAAEAETGLDWTPIYGGDVRRCVPLVTNCALVRYARVLARIAAELGEDAAAREFIEDADRRAQLIRRYCWNDASGLYLEYDYVDGAQLPFVSASAYWPMWAGVATRGQADTLVETLRVLEHPYGLALTDKAYDDPHPNTSMIEPDTAADAEVVGGREHLQWMYPAGWACMQIIAVEALDAYGHADHAARIANGYLTAIVERHEETSEIWEKYNVLDGGLELPNSRYGNLPYLSWSAGAAVVFGRRLFLGETLVEPGPAPIERDISRS